jgi:hypothetical protein
MKENTMNLLDLFVMITLVITAMFALATKINNKENSK